MRNEAGPCVLVSALEVSAFEKLRCARLVVLQYWPAHCTSPAAGVLQAPPSHAPRPASLVVVASPDKFDPRSVRQNFLLSCCASPGYSDQPMLGQQSQICSVWAGRSAAFLILRIAIDSNSCIHFHVRYWNVFCRQGCLLTGGTLLRSIRQLKKEVKAAMQQRDSTQATSAAVRLHDPITDMPGEAASAEVAPCFQI